MLLNTSENDIQPHEEEEETMTMAANSSYHCLDMNQERKRSGVQQTCKQTW